MKTCVLIPAHNESLQIGFLVEGISSRKLDVIVIDDGSTDSTGEIAENKGAILIRNESKQGKGQSLQKGFDYVLESGYQGVITMDGDGQHDLSDLDSIVAETKSNSIDILTGNRMVNHQGMPPVRYYTNRFMSGLISLVCRQKIPDTQCGFRYISSRVLKEIRITSSDFEIETEVLIKAAKKGFKIRSLPIKTIYRNEESKINPVKDTYRFIVYLFKELFSP